MPAAPSPSPVHVIVDTGPAEWWQILAALGPLAILVGAGLAALISWRTLRQRTAADALALSQKSDADTNALRQNTDADSRAEWWRRAQWAFEAAMDDKPEKQDVGLPFSSCSTPASWPVRRKPRLLPRHGSPRSRTARRHWTGCARYRTMK